MKIDEKRAAFLDMPDRHGEKKAAFLALFLAALGLLLLLLFLSSATPMSVSVYEALGLEENAPVSVTGRIETISVKSMEYVSIRICDETGCITANFHRSAYNPFLLTPGQYVTVIGNVRAYKTAKTISASQVIA